MSQNNSSVHNVAQIGFAKDAEVYDKTRPTYPVAALTKVLEVFNLSDKNRKMNVLDLAAGTGIFTKLLVNIENFNVYAVEPVNEMREILEKNLPNVKAFNGTSTELPFDDGFFDIVFVAQAFHWFANIESLREINRVIRKPNDDTKSGLVLIWNMEDRDSEAYIGELRDLYEAYDVGVPQYRKNEWKKVFDEDKSSCELFVPRITHFFQNSVYIPKSHVWPRITSKSYIASLDDQERGKLKVKVDQVLDKYNHKLVDETLIHFPHVTELVWCFKKYN